MHVCLQDLPLQTHTLKHTHTEMGSDSVIEVSALCPLAPHALLCVIMCVTMYVCPNIQSDWVYVCLRGYCQGMGVHHSVLSDWLIGVVVYIVSLCPVKRNRPPTDCSLCTRQSSHQARAHTHTHHYSPRLGRPCYYADTLLLSHFGRLASQTWVCCS